MTRGAVQILIAISCLFGLASADNHPITSDDWFAMTMTIQRDIDQADFENRQLRSVNAEDRRFVQKMINELTVGPDAMPTKAQARWLLLIREWVKR